jgi:4-hydroxybenzoate polyprenyltransferase
VINDYFDRKIDLINRPGTVIIGRLFKRRAAIFWHAFFNVAGIFTGFWMAFSVGKISFGIVWAMMAGMLWFYSTTYKRQLFIGNLMIALLVSFVPLLVLLFEFPLLLAEYELHLLVADINIKTIAVWIIAYASFAFIITLIREIIKDMEDYEGDRTLGCNTIPIALGMRTAKIVVISLSVITLSALVFIIVRFLNDWLTVTYMSVFLFFPFAFGILVLARANQKKKYTILSKIFKLIMVAGLLYCLVVFYIVKFELTAYVA